MKSVLLSHRKLSEVDDFGEFWAEESIEFCFAPGGKNNILCLVFLLAHLILNYHWTMIFLHVEILHSTSLSVND